MLGKELFSVAAATAMLVMWGCGDANVGTNARNTQSDAGTSRPSGTAGTDAAVGAGGKSGGSQATAGTNAAGAGGMRGNGASGGATGAGGARGHDPMADAGAARDAGAATTGSGGHAGDAGQMPASKTCTDPAHVLPMNPQNAQDGITLSDFYVDTDTWNAANYQLSQTMYICDYDNWYVVANMNNDSGDGAVKTYPNVHKDFNDAPAISSFSTISSSFAHSAPHVGIYEFAYDIWLNGVASNGSTEVMIWTDNYKQVPSGSSLDSVTYDGRSYDVYKSGSYIAFVETSNVTSGTLNLLSFFNYIIDKGWIPSTSTLGAIDYGIELVSTGGKDATFEVNDFSLITN